MYADVAAGRMRADPPYATFGDGHEEMLVGDAIAQSAAEQRWVEVQREPAPTAKPVLEVVK